MKLERDSKNSARAYMGDHVDNLVDCSDSLDEFWENIDNLWYD